MELDTEFLAFLEVRPNGDDLVLRLDASDERTFESHRGSAVEIELKKCRDFEESLERLGENKGALVWNYEFSETERKFSIILDDGNEYDFACDAIVETTADLTIDELSAKMKEFFGRYVHLSESNAQGWRKYRALAHLLTTELEKECHNLESRKAFFEENNPPQAEKAEAMMKFCHRIQNYIEQIEKE